MERWSSGVMEHGVMESCGIRGCPGTPALRHSNTPSLRAVLAQPVQVTFVPRGNRQYDELGSVVWMLGNNELLQCPELRTGCLEDTQHLRARLDFAFPPVVRLDPGNQIGAGDESGFEGGAGK